MATVIVGNGSTSEIDIIGLHFNQVAISIMGGAMATIATTGLGLIAMAPTTYIRGELVDEYNIDAPSTDWEPVEIYKEITQDWHEC